MILRWMKLVQYVFLGAIILLTFTGIGLHFTRNEASSGFEIKAVKKQLPKSSFTFGPQDYLCLRAFPFFLNYVAPCLHLPDLKGTLIYYGQNGRPDLSKEAPKVFFGLQGGKAIAAASPGEKIYLCYDKSLTSPCKYVFSPYNEPSSVWFTAVPENKEVKLTVEMSGVDGFPIAREDAGRHITLQEKEFTRSPTMGAWEIGKWRVDGSLLVRQKARWVGVDLFLENHGGDEFLDFAERHRIDFGEGNEIYSVFVKKGDFLVWDQDRWQMLDPQVSSEGKPILVIRKIEEKMMNLDIWDVEGRGKVALALIKAPESFHHEQIIQDFRFVGARTKTQVVFQVDEERLIVKPNDWLLLTQEGWQKLDTVADIDDFVSRKLVGTLFIFNEIVKKDEKTILMGNIYNPSRTQTHAVEVAMLSSGSLPPTDMKNSEKQLSSTPIATH